MTFSFDGYFDFMAKIKLRGPLVAFSKFRLENVFLAVEPLTVIVYHIDGKNFFRLATEDITGQSAIKAAAIAQNDRSVLLLNKEGNQIIIL
jgi:hypothetical protein